MRVGRRALGAHQDCGRRCRPGTPIEATQCHVRVSPSATPEVRGCRRVPTRETLHRTQWRQGTRSGDGRPGIDKGMVQVNRPEGRRQDVWGRQSVVASDQGRRRAAVVGPETGPRAGVPMAALAAVGVAAQQEVLRNGRRVAPSDRREGGAYVDGWHATGARQRSGEEPSCAARALWRGRRLERQARGGHRPMTDWGRK